MTRRHRSLDCLSVIVCQCSELTVDDSGTRAERQPQRERPILRRDAGLAVERHGRHESRQPCVIGHVGKECVWQWWRCSGEWSSDASRCHETPGRRPDSGNEPPQFRLLESSRFCRRFFLVNNGATARVPFYKPCSIRSRKICHFSRRTGSTRDDDGRQ